MSQRPSALRRTRLGLVGGLATLLLALGLAAPAVAQEMREVRAAWSIVREDQPGEPYMVQGSPETFIGCSSTAFLQVQVVPGAVSYRAEVFHTDHRLRTTFTYNGPPFDGDAYDVGGRIARAPAGSHRWGLASAGVSSGGCAGSAYISNAAAYRVDKVVAILAGPPTTIKGQVFAQACSSGCGRRPLEGVTVRATGGPGGQRTGTTGANGRYEIEVQGGRWTLVPRLGEREFEPASQQVTVRPKGAVTAEPFFTCGAPDEGPEADGGQAQAQTRPGAQKVCAPDGIDWTMPPRLDKQDARWGESPLLPRDLAYPRQWRVDLFLSSGGARIQRCEKGDRWRWTVTPPAGARVLTKPKDGCTPHVVVSKLGKYRVRARNLKDGTLIPRRAPATVVAKDILIVGLGDSNGSGEGNADSFRVRRCARGLASYQYQTAKYIEEQDERTSVTFIFGSCSGASITHLVDSRFRGTVPGTPKLDPQIMAAGQAIFGFSGTGADVRADPREVDAVLVSVGVNDLAFGPVLNFCVVRGVIGLTGCEDLGARARSDPGEGVTEIDQVLLGATQTLRDVVKVLQDALPGKYLALKAALRASPGGPRGGLGIRDFKRVFFTQYPDFSLGPGMTICDTQSSPGDSAFSIPKWPRSTWEWLSQQAALLNANVATGAASIDAHTVVIPASEWAGHGYCVSSRDTFFTFLVKAAATGDLTGPFHPNERGHQVEARFNQQAVCRKLYGNTTCSGKIIS